MRSPICIFSAILTMCTALSCGGDNQRKSYSKFNLLHKIHKEDYEDITLSKINLANVSSEKTLKELSKRGDAFYNLGDLILRGTTLGLIVAKPNQDFSAVEEQSHVYLQDAVNDIAVVRDFAFAACGPSGVAIIDLSSPLQPTYIGTINTKGAALRLTVNQDMLVIADGSMGLVVMNIADPFNPKLESLWPSSGYVRDLAIDNRNIYLAEDIAGVTLLKMRPSKKTQMTWRHNTGGQARSVFFDGGAKLYVANGNSGLLVLDVSKRRSPERLGSIQLKDTARDVVVSKPKNRAFVANGDDGIAVIDIADPGAMKITSRYTASAPCNRVFLEDNLLFVGNDSKGLLILDISNPDDPKLVFPKSE